MVDRRRSEMLLLGSCLLVCLLNSVSSQPCPDGWRRNQQSCYLLVDTPKTWRDARDECHLLQADLASLTTTAEQTWVGTQVGATYWFGLSDIVAEDGWQWADGTDYDPSVTNWGPNEPNNQNGEDCAEILSDGRWNDQACTDMQGYICERRTGLATTCRAGWQLRNGRCYFFSNNQAKLSWLDAQKECERRNANLVSITNLDEQAYVAEKSLSVSPDGIWIGLSNVNSPAPNQPQWSNGMDNFTYDRFTTGGQPNWQWPGATCVLSLNGGGGGRWETRRCGLENRYICEKGTAGTSLLSGDCYTPLGMEDRFIPDGQISASTELDPQHAAKYGRLGIYDASIVGAAWCPTSTDSAPWIEISGIETQGARTNKWVVSYKLAFRDSPTNEWVNYTDINHRNGIFPANNDEDTRVRNILQEPHVTRFTRVYPVDWAPAGAAMRLELLGCDTKPATTYCDDGWVIWENYCYLFRTQELTWQQAENRCSQVGAHLASVRTGQENEFIRSHSAARKIWIGLNDKGTEGTWRWTDSTGVGYLNWLPNQPDDAGNSEDCVEMHTNGRWNDNRCNNNNVKQDSVCKKAPNNGSPPPPRTTVGWTSHVCPPDWEDNPLNDFCYQFHTGSFRTWHDARAVCQANGGDLVSINTPSESAYITGRVSLVTNMATMWIGAHDQTTEGGWSWVDGSPFTFLNWGGGEPNNAGNGGEDCTEIAVTNGNWNDLNCDNLRGYICKMRANVPTPTPVPDQPDEHILHICERNSDSISCQGDEVIQIVSANYGRTDPNVCSNNPVSVVDCLSSTAFQTVQSICDNQQSCTLDATNAVFGDPCSGTYKYLEVLYRCTLSVCLVPMGMEAGNIADYQLSASSNNQYAGRARLNYISSDNNPGGWVPLSGDGQPWVQVDFRATKKVTGVITQGRQDADQWVKTFMVQFSDDGISYRTYKGIDGNDKIFTANTDRSSSVSNNLANANSILTRFFRIAPIDYQGAAGLRFEVLGCDPASLRCPTGWTSFGDNCYRLYDGGADDVKSWRRASQSCGLQGAELASIANQAEQNFVYSLIQPASMNNVWLGLNDRDVQMFFQWSDGTPVTYTLWNDNEPNNYQGRDEDCVNMYKTNGFWNDAQCDSHYPYVCEIPKQSLPEPTVLPTVAGCEQINQVDEPYRKTWEDARAHCQSQGADLVSLHRDAEMALLTNQIKLTRLTSRTGRRGKTRVRTASLRVLIWSAFTEMRKWRCSVTKSRLREYGVDSVYTWSDGSAYAYLNWLVNEPNNAGGAEQCAEFYPNNGRWNDANCGTSNGFICERPLNPLQPPQPTQPLPGGCPVGWNSYRNKCYRFYLSDDTEKTWRDARDFCRGLGSNENYNLVAIENEYEQAFVISQLKGIRRTVWIGLFDNIDENQFYWTSGHPVTFTNWNDGEPNNWNSQPATSTCPSGFVAWRDSCYKLTQTSQPWAQADDACSREGAGAQVVSIYDIYEQSFIKSQFVQQQAWIGLSDQQIAGEYRWSSGWPVHFTAWGFNEPSRADGEGCVAMSRNGTWDDTDCSLQLPALCEITSATPPPTAPPMFGRCPDDTWLAIGSYCFYVEYGLANTDQTRKTWYEAEFECVSRGAHLASLHSSEERNAIISRQGSPLWIGMFRDTSGSLGWYDGDPVDFTSWGDGEPNNPSSGQCVMMDNDGTWNDVICTRRNGYVCKRDKIAYSAITSNSINPGSVPTVQYCQTTAEILFRGNCYRFHDEQPEDWAGARSICLLFGGDLTSINSGAETEFLLTQVANLRVDNFWIGLREYNFDGLYQWSDGSAYFFHNWKSGEPNDYMGAEQCVEFHKGDGYWNDLNCGDKQGFICKRPYHQLTPPPPTSPWAGGCPNNWLPYGNKCYYVVNNYNLKRNWEEARSYCKSFGQTDFDANLVAIENEYEQAFITSLLTERLGMWIGLFDSINENKFFWASGHSVTYTNWNDRQPNGFNNQQGDENCVMLHWESALAGKWNDAECSRELGFICQKYKDPQLPATTPTPSVQCAPGYRNYANSCYKLISSSQDWDSSAQICRQDATELASVTSPYEQGFLTSWLKQKVWIGLSDRQTAGLYTWSDSWPIYYDNWGEGEPSRGANEGCVAMEMNGLWTDSVCSQQLPAVCKKTFDTPPPTLPPSPGYCLDGWFEVGDACFFIETGTIATNRRSFVEAQAECTNKKSVLTSIHSQHVIDVFKQHHGWGVWIGMYLRSDGTVAWLDSTPVDFSAFREGEPDGDDGCTQMLSSGLWELAGCQVRKGYICSMPKLAGTRPPYNPNNPVVISPGPGQVSGQTGNKSGGLDAGSVIAILLAIAMVCILALVGGWCYFKRQGTKTLLSFGEKSPATLNTGFDNALYDATSGTVTMPESQA
uniref:Macrophage mannose receptor 1-like n=1 Tax=Branchiostoma floridae TaxID=7739 RepID=C3YFS1_BRAFL|eukprot:XP_002604716.1 hypothetical protein BRAFLDRAFT_80311 [Branchiostoma floridae]